MYMEDSKGMKHDVAGKGTTALGIIGTSLGGLALAGMAGGGGCNDGCGGGLLGGLFGGNGCGNDGCCKVNRFELRQSEAIGSLEATIAAQNSKIYSDAGDLGVYQALVMADKNQTGATNQLFRETFTAIAALDKAEAVNKMEIDKNFQLINQKLDCCCEKSAAALDCFKQSVRDNYIAADKYLSACHVTPYPQAANPQPVPTFVCGCGNA